MKAVILAGGRGTRLSEETSVRPKPMVEIGRRPILWHIMQIYAHYGVRDFIICAGYKGEQIAEYPFAGMLGTRVRVDVVDTGLETRTGGRLKRVAHLLTDTFCMTYGDGVADVDIGALIAFHHACGAAATMTVVRPPARFGAVDLNGHLVSRFVEKPLGDGGWINGGFFVLEPNVIELIDGDQTAWEDAPLQSLAAANELVGYRHGGFWHPMDTLRDKEQLNAMWAEGQAPWKVWE
jgi:glucose-1-phosphate cytidylyltransferase